MSAKLSPDQAQAELDKMVLEHNVIAADLHADRTVDLNGFFTLGELRAIADLLERIDYGDTGG